MNKSFFKDNKLCKYEYDITKLHHFFGERSYALFRAITEGSRAMTIEVVIFVFGVVLVVGWYLEWILPDPSIDSLVCVI